MIFLPFERISFPSNRSPDELVAALSSVTRPTPEFKLELIRRKDVPTFIGYVSKDRLYICRGVRGRNSFLPFVTGKIVTTPSGARIEAVMHPHIATLAFMGMFTLILAPAAVLAAKAFLQKGVFEEFEWVPLFMLVTLYAGCMIGYWPEARRMKRMLREFTGPGVET